MATVLHMRPVMQWSLSQPLRLALMLYGARFLCVCSYLELVISAGPCHALWTLASDAARQGDALCH